MIKYLIFIPVILVSYLSGCMPQFGDTSGADVYTSDFFVDNFSYFSSENWITLNRTENFSSLKPENVIVSNGFLIFRNPQNTTDSGGLLSSYKFKTGYFSSIVNTPSNIVYEMRLLEDITTSRISMKIKTLNDISIVICSIQTSLTNIYMTNTQIISNFNTLSILVTRYNVEFRLNNTILFTYDQGFSGNFNLELLSYLEELNTEIFDRLVYVDEFSYSKY